MKSPIVPVIVKYNIKIKTAPNVPIILVNAIFTYSFSSSLLCTCSSLYTANTPAKNMPEVCFISIVLPCN